MTPEHPDNQHGRMLFTDFDVSGKGRPVAVLPQPPPAPPPQSRMPGMPGSIVELASMLELDFEDDDAPAGSGQQPQRKHTPAEEENRKENGGEDKPASPGRQDESGRDAPGIPEKNRADRDDPFGLEPGSGLTLPRWQWPNAEPSPAAPAPVPTWEEFANAFRAPSRGTRSFQWNGQGNAIAESIPGISGGAGYGGNAANAPIAAYLAVADDGEGGDEVDVLSLIPSDAAENAGDGVDLPWPDPAYPDADAAPAAAHKQRAPRAVPPPPANPYGGLARIEDWYAPPENQPEPPVISGDWFEPPEATPDSVKDSSRDDVSDFLNSDLFNSGSIAGDSLRKSAKPKPGSEPADSAFAAPAASSPPPAPGTRAGTGPSPADTIVDLFSNFDIDKAWSARTDSSADSARANSDTAIIRRETAPVDLFSDVDLESAWRERQGTQPKSPSERQFRSSDTRVRSAKEETVILDGSTPGQSGFGIAPKHPRPAQPAPEKKGETKKQEPAVMEFLEDDPIEEPGGTGDADSTDSAKENAAPAAAASGHTTGRTVKHATGHARARAQTSSSAPSESKPSESSEPDYLDVMDELDDGAAASDIARPVIDNSAITSGATRRKTRAGASARIIPTLPDDIDMPGDFGESPESPESGDPAAIADKAVDDIFDLEEAAGEDPAFATGPQVSTDDLLKDIDFDDLGINDAVSAPVIDDSVIDLLGQGAPRPGTEATESAPGEGEPVDEAAPVNPADVFANMDDMDFSDDMDDDMRAMLDDGEESGSGGGVAVDATGDSLLARQSAELPEAPPAGFFGKMKYHAVRAIKRVAPTGFFRKLGQSVGWSENWWFYCDIIAAIIASASLAVIISYYFWYRS